MQKFVVCPFCKRVYDAFDERSAKVTIDGVERTAHQACVMGLKPRAPVEKGNGPVTNGMATP